MEKFDYVKEINNISFEAKIQLIIEQENFDEKVYQYAKSKDINNESLKMELKEEILKKYQLNLKEKNEALNILLNMIKKYKEIH